MKLCSKCSKQKEGSEFYKNSLRPDGLQAYCKECSNKARVAYAKNNYAKQRSYQIKKVMALREYIAGYLNIHHCIDCGNSNPIVLEFDHVRDNKLANISNLVAGQVSLAKLIAEIEKCEVRCANCHRIITYNRRNNIMPR